MDVPAQLQAAWTGIVATYSPGTIEFIGIALSQVVGFILPATVYMLIDTLFPKFSQRHKIQGARRQPTRQQIQHCIKVCLFNHAWIVGLQFILLYRRGFNHAYLNMDPTVPLLIYLVAFEMRDGRCSLLHPDGNGSGGNSSLNGS